MHPQSSVAMGQMGLEHEQQHQQHRQQHHHQHHQQHQQQHHHQHQHHQHHPHNPLADYSQDSTANWVDPTSATIAAAAAAAASYSTPQHHQSPVQEYNGFAFTPLPMEPVYSAPMHPPRTMHQQLQPLIMPQWPSMLTSQSTYVPPIFPSAPVPVPATPTPVSASSTRSTSSTPRKTLTDADRRRMCLYHEEHPTVKQTEIGAMFGVERSTVSKVLRQKEKYLYQDDGSRSPIKRSKGKFPDIERALSNWARNHQKQGLPLSDSMIREKARFFATTVGSSDGHLKVNSTSWLEKFKQKNNLMGSKSRKNSIAEESENGSNPASSAQTPGGISPTSPSGVSPSPVALTAASKADDTAAPVAANKRESPDSYVDFTNGHRPFHSQSNTSLSSVFTDTAPSSFSAGPTSPTSPFFTPDSGCAPSPFIPQGTQQSQQQQQQQQQQNRPATSHGSFQQRPRSQTFPMLGIEPYMSPPPASSDAMTPKVINTTSLDTSSANDHLLNPMSGLDEALRQQQQPQVPVKMENLMQPPPLPSGPAAVPHVTIPTQPQHAQNRPISPGSASPASPSQEDARRALELVMNFFQTQPSGFVEPQEYVMIGKLMEKLKLQRGGAGMGMGADALPGGMHRIPEQEYSVKKMDVN